MFVNRTQELAFLDKILTRNRPGPAQLILLYGRRRVGKTRLLQQWVSQQDVPYTYWTAEKEPAALQRRKFYGRLAGLSPQNAPTFFSWAEVWAAAYELLGQRRYILILDELPYAAEADPATLSALQHAWDQFFQESQTVIILCGSQVKAMETLQYYQSPLFGRMTGQWYLQPLAFPHLKLFFPTWTAAERVALYAIVGGVPAYLRWLDETVGLVANIRNVILDEGSMFIAEPTFLLYDEVREPRSYLAVLKAIGSGHHTLSTISNATLLPTSRLSVYLTRLQELRFIERRLPATVPPAKRRQSRQGRYHLIDPYFRFYFRFMVPLYETMTLDIDQTLARIRQELRAFVGQTTFEELSRQWVEQQGKAGQLPFVPQIVGSHWSRHVQIDIVAVNWQSKKILLGECKWTQDPIDRQIVRELIEQKLPKVKLDLPNGGDGWQISFAFFSRTGYTAAARTYVQSHEALLIDLAGIDADLQE
jgi:AAA+ ATPase superfamily predicted ATPase